MDDSSINPILLSSSAHLENVEQLIKNLEKHTLDMDDFEDIVSNRNRHDIITKSFSSLTSSTMAIDDIPDDNFLVKSISLANTGGPRIDEHLSMDSLFTQRELFDNDDIKKQQTPPGNDQSVSIDQEGGFSWDDQYDTRANYRLTFSTDKTQQIDPKMEKSHRHKHHNHHHRHHRKHRNDSQSNSIGSDDGSPSNLPNNMNDWSMRSSFNALEQSIDQRHGKPPLPSPSSVNQPQTSVIRSQSHPNSFSSQQQTSNANTSPNSSTTSSSSSASWKRMKDSQRTTSGVESKETRPPSPLSLYKIFQQKSQMNASSSSRSAFQYYRQQTDSIVPNNNDGMTISGEKILGEKSKSSYPQKRQMQTDRSSSQTNSSTDQAIQTSILLDSSNSPMNSRFQSTPTPGFKSDSYDHLSTYTNSNTPQHLTIPSRQSPASIASSSIHKSLPDLAFISQYSKELPRSRTTSPLPPMTTHMAPSSTIVQQKQESERPRTLKSIKRYKNSKHSTEPLGVFFSPQLCKTFAAIPASAIVSGTNEGPKIIKMKLPPPSSYPIAQQQQQQQQQTTNLKSCLKYGSRANSCDIEAMLQDRRSPAPTFAIPEPMNNRESVSPTNKRRCSEADVLSDPPNTRWSSNAHTTGSSNDLNSYVIPDMSRERHSDYDLMSFQQQNQTKKSVSFSENIAKHLISPCNPAIKFDPPPEISTEDDEVPSNHELTMILHGNKENLKRKVTARYGEMRRCQTDVIVVDRVHHLHSFTESPPNEFCLRDSFAPGEEEDEDDQSIMEKAHVNIIDEHIQILPTQKESTPIIEKMSSSNDKENKVPEPSINMTVSTITLNPTNDPSLDGILENINDIVKRIFEIKRSEKAFFLTNENNTQLDKLLKNELSVTLQTVLEHGLISRKDLPLAKQTTLWKIIEASIDHGQSLQVFNEARQFAQNASAYWVYKFQAFIFFLLNKNELINWLYYYMKQKDTLQRYYQSPDALILVVTSSTFTLFDRLMALLEKLSPLAFRLVYKSEPIPSNILEQLNTSTINLQPTKTTARDWVMTISRRTSKTLTQPIVQATSANTNAATAASTTQPTDTLRTTLSRKINSLFTKTNPTPSQRKTSSAVTARLPMPKTQTARQTSPAPTSSNRSRTPNTFANPTTTKPVIVTSPKLNHGPRTGAIRRGISPSVVVAPSPPPTLNTTTGTPQSTTSAFQSKIPRPSLNVDKPKSARYRSTAPSTK